MTGRAALLPLAVLLVTAAACDRGDAAGAASPGDAPFVAAGPPPEPILDGAPEPVELSLLRTVHLGAPVALSADEIAREVSPEQPSHTRWVLAVAALTVLGRPLADPPLPSVLDDLLTQIRDRGGRDRLPEGAPPGYGDDDLVYTVVYALAVSGRARAAESVLAAHVDGGSRYKRAVALQALHLLGGRSAMNRIQEATEVREIGFFAGVLTRRPRDPSLRELARHWRGIAPADRTRGELFGHIEDGCTSPAILASYLAGFLPPAADRSRRRRDVEILRGALDTFPRRGCYNGRYFALRSLALQSAEEPATWARLAASLEVAQLRQLAAKAGFAHHPQAFAPLAFERLSREPAQHAQWELLWGTVRAWTDIPYRDVWDLWHDAPDLQLRLEHKPRVAALDAEGQRAFLDALEAGRRPSDERVLDWVLMEVARGARGSEAFRLLRYLDGLPLEERTGRYWVLMDLEEPAALPLLRYWAEGDAPPAQKERLLATIDRLAEGGQNLFTARYPTLCCDTSEACLESQVHAQLYGDPERALTGEDDVRAWLDGAVGDGDLRIARSGPLGRAADVTEPGSGRTHRFEHLYGCWRLVEG